MKIHLFFLKNPIVSLCSGIQRVQNIVFSHEHLAVGWLVVVVVGVLLTFSHPVRKGLIPVYPSAPKFVHERKYFSGRCGCFVRRKEKKTNKKIK